MSEVERRVAHTPSAFLDTFAERRGTTAEALIAKANSWRPPRRLGVPDIDALLKTLKWL
jgi:hypothetical protein